MTYNDIVTKVSGELNLPKGLVDKTYKAYWKVIREHITSLPLKEDLSQEEFSKLQPNVNIPSIGKLCVTPERYRRMKKMQAIRNQNKQEKNVTHNED
jgi:hypothetical protein